MSTPPRAAPRAPRLWSTVLPVNLINAKPINSTLMRTESQAMPKGRQWGLCGDHPSQQPGLPRPPLPRPGHGAFLGTSLHGRTGFWDPAAPSAPSQRFQCLRSPSCCCLGAVPSCPTAPKALPLPQGGRITPVTPSKHRSDEVQAETRLSCSD